MKSPYKDFSRELTGRFPTGESTLYSVLHPTQMRILSFDNPRLASISDPARSIPSPVDVGPPARARTITKPRRGSRTSECEDCVCETVSMSVSEMDERPSLDSLV